MMQRRTIARVHLLLGLLVLWIPYTAGTLSVQAAFNQRGVRGTILFSQDSVNSNTTITINLTNLDQFPDQSYPWHVHQYPFPLGVINPCRGEITGGHYDPLGANTGASYVSNCAMNSDLCELGDLSGKFGPLRAENNVIETFTDPRLFLYGVYSIIGRSVVIHFENGTRFICANIEYPATTTNEILYVPFRRVFAGNIYLRQHSNTSTTSVYADLTRVDSILNSNGHNWHIHQSAVDTGDTSCQSAGPHYNPRSVDTDNGYQARCNSTAQNNCEVGDLSNKGAPLDVRNRAAKLLYTDTDLQLLGQDISVVNRSVVIHAENRTAPRIACANITTFRPLEAVANFQDSGVSGSIRFLQYSPFDQTQVTVMLNGLQRIAGGYHVHEFPVGPGMGGSGRCAVRYTGGHWNPRGIVYNEENPRITSDNYEIGDLSGKFGSLSGMDRISQTYTDPNIPLSGMDGIIGRSVVIHFTPNGSRWVCSNIDHVRPVLQFSAVLDTPGFSGRVTFIQPADDPSAATTIIVEVELGAVPVVTESPVFQPTTQLQAPVTSGVPVSPLPLTSPPQTSMPFTTMSTQPSSSMFQPTTQLQAPVTSIPVAMVASTSPVGVPVLPLPLTSPPQTSMPFTTMSTQPSSSMFRFSTSTAVFPTTPFLPPRSTPGAQPSTMLGAPSSALPSPTPTPSSNIVGSGEPISLLLGTSMLSSNTVATSSNSDRISPSPSSTPLSGRRRRSAGRHAFLRRSLSNGRLQRVRRQTMASGFGWSLRIVPAGGMVADCGEFPVFDPFMSNPSLCSASNPLACSAGDLTSKHGPLSPGVPRAVFTDPNLPLSGPNAVFTPNALAVLLIHPFATSTTSPLPSDCALVAEDTPSPTMTPTETPTESNVPVLVGAIVGGVLGALLIAAIIIIVVVCCLKYRRRGYDFEDKKKISAIELGTVKRTEPRIGAAQYRVLHNYVPQSKGDLALTQGDWVTLIEAPYGGEWWRGSIGEEVGWFPKTYVEFVDVEAEKKRLQDENFKMAAAAIVAASSSFSARHPSLSMKRRHDIAVTKRAHTISKSDIDSTPKLVTKFDRQEKEKQEESLVIENIVREGSSTGGSRPDTPKSQRGVEIITNKGAVSESGGSSQESDTLAPLPGLIETTAVAKTASPLRVSTQGLPSANTNLLPSDRYEAKYDFIGSTEIELALNKGDIVSVIERVDNGWWKGVCGARVGWFPKAYVQPAPLEASKEQSLFPRKMEEMMSSGEEFEVTEYRAVFPFHSATQGDLTFTEGETILVYWGNDSGWWYGAARSEQGWFPGSYVEPIMDLSEAGSLAASPTNLTQEEAPPISSQIDEHDEGEGGSLASEIAAVLKLRKARKVSKEESHEKRKKWSFKKSRGSRKEETAGSSHSESVTSPEAVGTQEELVASIARCITPELQKRQKIAKEQPNEEGWPHTPTDGRKMSIDEQVMVSKEMKANEDATQLQKNELMSVFVKRNLKKDQPQSIGDGETTQQEGGRKENEPTADQQRRKQEEAGPPVQEGASTENARQTEHGGKLELLPKVEHSPSSGVHGQTMTEPGSPGKPPHPSQPSPKKPRRRAPPPPPTTSPLATQESPKIQKTPIPTPPLQRPSPILTSTPTSSHQAPSPTPTPPLQRPSPITPPTSSTLPSDRRFTSAAHASHPHTTRPRPMRRTTASGVDQKSKPRRRPPPPPPSSGSAGGPAGGPTATAIKTLEPVKETDSVFVEMPQGSAPPPHPPQPAKREPPPRPVAPARRRPRMQRVKRPVSRNIPPPPSIPLPPPPARKKIQSESDTQVLSDSKPVSSDVTPPSVEGSKIVKPPLKPKPAVLPKPAHLAESVKRRHSESSITSLSTQGSEESPPSSAACRNPSPSKVARGPKPPPPTRTSSLSDKQPRPMKRQHTSPLPSISDVVEETDSPHITKETATEVKVAEVGGATVEISESKMAVIKSEPPLRPPPPKPRVEEPDGKSTDKRKSEPPVRPPPMNAASKVDGRTKSAVQNPQLHGTILFDASTEEPGQGISRNRGSAGSSLKAKGNSLMRSLKKMVKRSESKREESEKPMTDKQRTLSASDEEGSKPPRPSQPPKLHPDNHKVELSTPTSQQQASTVTPPNSAKSSPVPKPRAKLHVQEPSEASEPEDMDTSREGVRDSKLLPPRPPPPGSSENGVAEGKKDPPSRPPPPSLRDAPQKTAINGNINPSETGVENGPKPTPHPRTKDPELKSQTSSEGGTSPGDSKPIPTPRKSVSPPPSSPIDSPRTPTNFYRAMKDYKAQRDTELTFSSGDILIEIDCPSEEFHYGMLDDGTTGLFPVSLVEPFYSPK